MFQTDLHVALQGFFDAGWMLPLMTAISALGYATAYMVLIAVCAFGLRLRAGLMILLAVLLMSGVSSMVKQATDLPRPSDIDARVLDKGRSGRALLDDGRVAGFWSLPSQEAIARFRDQQGSRDPGFLSGHVGAASAACMALLLGFGVRSVGWRLALVVGWPLLMALSRMYLGRHFLADVLAGWLAGLAVAVLACWLFPRVPAAARNRWRLAVIGVLALAWAGVASVSGWIEVDTGGQLAGLFIVLVVLQCRSWPDDPRRTWQRFARPLAFIVISLAMGPVLHALASALPLPDTRLVSVAWHAVGITLVMLLTLALFALPGSARRRMPAPDARHDEQPRPCDRVA